MKCRICESTNPKDAKFCNACGAKLETVCQACGKINPAGSNYCNGCGKDLRAVEKAETVVADELQPYTPKFLSDNLLAKQTAVEGERKQATVMFADVANSVPMFEKLDPEEVHWIIDKCFKLLMEDIHRYGGTVNQFMGDGLLALFGAPVAHEDHASRACRAALSIQRAMVDYGDKIRREFDVDFKIRIGINSGPVIVGAIGDKLRMDFTAVGNTVNLASRIEHQAQPGTIVITRATYRLVKDYFILRPLDSIEVKGFRGRQEIFELVKSTDIGSSIEALVQKGLTHFVGRSNSMAALMDAFNLAKNGSGQLVDIVGEAGTGKSRLLYEFKSRLPEGEFSYVKGSCVHFGSTMPYFPILDALRSFFDIGEGEQEITIQKRVREKIASLSDTSHQLLPPIQDLLSIEVEDKTYLALESKQRKERIFEALRDLVIQGSQKRPMIIAVEDLHWIDKASEEYLDYFIGWLANIKVMLILLHRPEYTHHWTNRSYYNRIGVIQLTQARSEELVDAILGGGPVAPEIYDFVMKKSAGNPLFIEELIHSLIDDGTIQKREDRYILNVKVSELKVPDTIQGIIASRIDRLDDSVKKIIQLASVIGRQFAFNILQTITDKNENLKTNLLNLQGIELIYEKNLIPELEFIFKHALTVEVTYNSLLSKKRKAIHRRIGKAIEMIYAANLEEYYEILAYHYSKGEQIDEACQYLMLSGKKAARNHALLEAYNFYKQAVELLHKLPGSQQQKCTIIEAILLMRIPIALLGFPEDCLSFFQIGKRLAEELEDTRSLVSFHALMGTYYSHTGDHLSAMQYTEERFDKACQSRDIDSMAPLCLTICTSYFATNQYEKIIRKMPAVATMIEATGRQSEFFLITLNPYAYICGTCGAALGHMGDFDAGQAYLDKALSIATDIGELSTLGATRFYFGWLYYTKGEYDEAKSYFEKCITDFKETKWHLGVAFASCHLGHLNFLLGSPEAGQKQAEKGIQMFHERNIELYLSWCKWVMGCIYLDLACLDDAQRYMQDALNSSRKNNEKGVEGLALVGLGRVLGKKDPAAPDQAIEQISAGLDILDHLKMTPWKAQGTLFLGELYQNAGDRDKACEYLEIAKKMFQKMEMAYWTARAEAYLRKVLSLPVC